MSSALKALTAQFDGDVIEPDDSDYASACRAVLATGSPAFVLRPTDASGVQAAVEFAAGSGLRLSVRGGGHSFAGFGTNDGGVVIDLSRLAGVEVVDPAQHVVRIGGGATWGQVAATLAPLNLAISSGDTKTVGVGGLTLSGGIGWKVRKRGLALDNVVAAEVVTADGHAVRTSPSEHPELFWAIRGGGGNLGVVTAFDFAAHRTTDVFFGSISFSSSQAASVLLGWAQYMRTAPEELTSNVVFANPFLGGPQAPVQVLVAYDGDNPQLAAQAIDPIRGLGAVLDDDVALTPYPDTLEDGGAPPAGIEFLVRNGFVYEGSVPRVLEILAEVGASEGSPIVLLRSLGGAVSRVSDQATAYAHRGAELMIMTTFVGPGPVIDLSQRSMDRIWDRLGPDVRGAYANFLTRATEAAVAAIYPSATHARLSAIKQRYDPDNLFAGNHNIRPRAQACPEGEAADPTPDHPHPR